MRGSDTVQPTSPYWRLMVIQTPYSPGHWGDPRCPCVTASRAQVAALGHLYCHPQDLGRLDLHGSMNTGWVFTCGSFQSTQDTHMPPPGASSSLSSSQQTWGWPGMAAVARGSKRSRLWGATTPDQRIRGLQGDILPKRAPDGCPQCLGQTHPREGASADLLRKGAP